MSFDLTKQCNSLNANEKALRDLEKKTKIEAKSEIHSLTGLVKNTHQYLENLIKASNLDANAREIQLKELPTNFSNKELETKIQAVLELFTDKNRKSEVLMITKLIKNNFEATLNEITNVLTLAPTLRHGS